jgi:hypothetical protein
MSFSSAISGTLEAARTSPQHAYANRFDTRHILGPGASGSAPSTAAVVVPVSDVDNGKFFTIAMGAGDVRLVLPAPKTCVGVVVRGVVQSTGGLGTLTIALALFDNLITNAEIFAAKKDVINAGALYSLCLSRNNGVAKVDAGFSYRLGIHKITAGSTFSITCTGTRWMVSVIGSSVIPDTPGNPLTIPFTTS